MSVLPILPMVPLDADLLVAALDRTGGVEPLKGGALEGVGVASQVRDVHHVVALGHDDAPEGILLQSHLLDGLDAHRSDPHDLAELVILHPSA